VRTYIHDAGTLANVHFVAIPFNASAADGAQVAANFLLSPEAQIRKANPDIWGDPTVLSIPKLDAADAKAFADLPRGMATLSPADLNRTLPEPHPSWVGVIERAWMARYSAN
jgi:putative thiamine transport system substrate-binding protein